MKLLFRLLPILLLALPLGGCRPGSAVEDDGAEVNPWKELNTEMGKVQEGIDQTLRRIRELPDVKDRDPEYARVVDMLTMTGRFEKALDVVSEIETITLRDRLLQDLARVQAEEAFRHFELLRKTVPKPLEDESVQHYMTEAVEIARRIEGPLCRIEAFSDIAALRLDMDDTDIALALLAEEVDRLKKSTTHREETARALCHLARWQLRREDKPRALALCRDAEKALPEMSAPFPRASTGLDLLSLYTLSGDTDGVWRVDRLVESAASEISSPREKATILLRLAEATLHLRLKEPDAQAGKVLDETKKLVLESVRLQDEATGGPETFGEETNRLLLLLPEEFQERKNEMLRRIAVFQIWSVPLEEAWETVLDIDPGPMQDEAIIAAARMLLLAGAFDDAEAWAEEITDPAKKQALKREIEQAKQKSK